MSVFRSKTASCFVRLIIVVGFLVFSGCQSAKSSTSTTGYLPGGTLLILELPLNGPRPELIGVSEDKVASRSFVPRSSPVAINSVIFPDAMWQDLEALRRAWCAQPPTFATGTPSDSHYKVTFHCGRIRNPVLSVLPDQLPSVLGDLVHLVPSVP